MALGGGGIVTLIVVLAIVLLGGNPLDAGTGGLGGLDNITAGAQPPAEQLDHCQTGEDANTHEDCRILAVVNSVQRYWEGALRGIRPRADAFLRRRGLDGLRQCDLRRRAVLLPGRPLRLHRPRLLRPARVAVRRVRRSARAGVRDRARVRPPRPEPHRDAPPRAERRHRPAERCRPRRAPGRLLRGRVGRERGAHGPHRGDHARGRPGRAERGRCRRRRPHPGARSRAGSRPRPGRTARRSSARAGSCAGSRAAARTPATLSPAGSR